MTPTIEKDDLQEAILWWIVYLYLFLLLTILLVNVLVLHRTLRPLYALLRWFDSYTVGGKNAPLVNDTKVIEFRRLNEAANRYAERAESLFERQNSSAMPRMRCRPRWPFAATGWKCSWTTVRR